MGKARDKGRRSFTAKFTATLLEKDYDMFQRMVIRYCIGASIIGTTVIILALIAGTR